METRDCLATETRCAAAGALAPLLWERGLAAALPADRCSGLKTAVGYLTGHRDYLRYDHALEQGWPIATGIVEGTARHLVGDRLEITGARWGLAGAEAILRLRAVISNGDLGR